MTGLSVGVLEGCEMSIMKRKENVCELRVTFEQDVLKHANNSKLTPLDGEMERPGLGLDVKTD